MKIIKMMQSNSTLSKKASFILESRFSGSSLPNETVEPDSLMDLVKSELKTLKKSKETFKITIQESPSIIKITKNSSLDLHSTTEISIIESCEKENDSKNSKSEKHSFPIIKRSLNDEEMIRPRIGKKLKRLGSLGYPKPYRSFNIRQSLKKPVTSKTPQAYTNVTGRRQKESSIEVDSNFIVPKTSKKNDSTLPINVPTPVSKFNDKNFIIKNPNCVEERKDQSKSITVKKSPVKNIQTRLITSTIDGKLIFTAKSARKRSFNSDTKYNNMCETIKDRDYQPTSFAFEAVEVIDTFHESEKLDLDHNIVAGMLRDSKTDNVKENYLLKDPLSTEPITKVPKVSSTQLARTSVDDSNDPKATNAKKRKSPVIKKKNHDNYEIDHLEKFDAKNNSNGINKENTRKSLTAIDSEVSGADNNDKIINPPLSTEPITKVPKVSSTLLARTSVDNSNDPKATNAKKRKSPVIKKKNHDNCENDHLEKFDAKNNSNGINKENTRKSLTAIDSEVSGADNNDKIINPPLSQSTVEKLKNIVVTLEHEVPEQHKIGKCCSVSLSKIEKKKFTEYRKIKSGKFSENEDIIIKKNWQRFCELHDLKIVGENFFQKRYNNTMFIKDKKQRKRFVQFLANGLFQRTLFSVFKRFERLYEFRGRDEIKSQRYTKKEDKIIIKYFENYTPDVLKSTVLPKILNRPYDSIHRRYYYLKGKLNNNITHD